MLRGLGVADVPPTVTFEGLKEKYKAGEELQFSVRLEGYWNDCGIFLETEVLISRDGGSSYDVVIWQDAGTANDYDNPGCDHDADKIDKTLHVKGNLSHLGYFARLECTKSKVMAMISKAQVTGSW